MEIRPIRNKADYRAALKEIEGLMDAGAGTPQGERLDVLATFVEAYEKKHRTWVPDKSARGRR
jgi:HTH-type transcriptional regulator/antitoxin HigA